MIKPIIFLDIDGVLNCELFYLARHKRRKLTIEYWINKFKWKLQWVFNGFKHESISLGNLIKQPQPPFSKRFKRFKEETCKDRISWLDHLCEITGANVVISSTWRKYFTVPEWNEVFFLLDAKNIKVIGITTTRKEIRGLEIKDYLDKNKHDNYVIIDDDSDMLPEQTPHLFLTDPYSGLTPNTCYRIKRFLNKQ